MWSKYPCSFLSAFFQLPLGFEGFLLCLHPQQVQVTFMPLLLGLQESKVKSHPQINGHMTTEGQI